MRRAVLLAAWAMLGTAGAARAGELRHRLGDGESLETVAKNYYGSSWKAVYIQTRNELDSTTKVAGLDLVIPSSWTYTVRKGDSLASIAKRHLGDTSRHKALMAFNNIRDASELAVGQALLMPFHLSHTVKPNETVAQISQRYYRTTKRVTILKEYNQTDAFKAGQRLTVPIFDSATIDAPTRRYTAAAAPANAATPTPAAATPTPPVAAAPSPAEARQTLKQAIAGYGAGEYDNTCPALERLLEANPLTGADAAELIKYLGFCAVAFDDFAAARDYFRKWLELDPKATLDPVLTSPKIRKVFFDVSGEPPAPEPSSTPALP